MEPGRWLIPSFRTGAAVCVCSVSPLGHRVEPPRLDSGGGSVVKRLTRGPGLTRLARGAPRRPTPGEPGRPGRRNGGRPVPGAGGAVEVVEPEPTPERDARPRSRS